MVAVAKSMVKKASDLADVGIMVMVYNATPSVHTGVSPAEMLMQRKLRTCLPTLSSPEFVPSEKIVKATEKKRQHATEIKAKYDRTAKDLPPLRVESRGLFTCPILTSIVAILVSIEMILTSIEPILEKCVHLQM